MRTPESTSEWFANVAGRILHHVELAGKPEGKELVSTLTDAKILAWLARFHAYRLKAGVSYCLFEQTGDLSTLGDAIAREKEALAAWERIVAAAGDVYSDKLAFGVERVGFPRHWKDELPRLRAGIASLEQQLKTADASSKVVTRSWPSDHDPPKVQLLPVGTAKPGVDLEIAVKAGDRSGMKAVRLRYRHLTQYEDYQTAEMTMDRVSGVYRARIPGSFVTREWDLMYFVEAVSKAGNGVRSPDLDREAPYRIVSVAR
jgi:hypothetical protein